MNRDTILNIGKSVPNCLITIVMYHYVRELMSSNYKEIKGLEVKQFIEQLKYFKKKYHIISVVDLINHLDFNEPIPSNALLLTFDDGYKDHVQYVLPILLDFNIKGAFYIPAKTVKENVVLDVNKIHFILACCTDKSVLLDKLKIFIEDNNSELDCYDFYFEQYAKANRFDCKEIIFIKRMLQHVLPEKLRSVILNQLFSEFVSIDESSFSQELYVSTKDLSHLLEAGMHIGAHGYEHYWWDKLSDVQLNFEIDQSIIFLNSLGVNMDFWTACYPYGAYNDKTIQFLKNKGCKLALTTNAEMAVLSDENRWTLPRLDTNDFPPIKK